MKLGGGGAGEGAGGGGGQVKVRGGGGFGRLTPCTTAPPPPEGLRDGTRSTAYDFKEEREGGGRCKNAHRPSASPQHRSALAYGRHAHRTGIEGGVGGGGVQVPSSGACAIDEGGDGGGEWCAVRRGGQTVERPAVHPQRGPLRAGVYPPPRRSNRHRTSAHTHAAALQTIPRGGLRPAMHWTGGELPPPPSLQRAQPKPSHCLPDGKCQPQRHL